MVLVLIFFVSCSSVNKRPIVDVRVYEGNSVTGTLQRQLEDIKPKDSAFNDMHCLSREDFYKLIEPYAYCDLWSERRPFEVR